jgi:hypothetical protein
MFKKIIFSLLSIFSINLLIADDLENRFLQSDAFKTGYLQSKLDSTFPNTPIQVRVSNDQVIVYQDSFDEGLREQIRHFLAQQNYYSVEFNTEQPFLLEEATFTPSLAESIQVKEGNWLPELTPFFPTMLADPRKIGYSIGYRSYDKIFKTALIPISMGDRFSLYQFKKIGGGHLHLGIEAGVWAVFEAKPKSLALINADYYVGIPLTYLNGKFSTRLRLYHQSSHLGDELLVERKNIHRLNPSMEVVDLFVSYAFTKNLTVFGGIGRVIRSDKSFSVKPYHVVYGFNYFIEGCKFRSGNLEATPFIGMYFNNWQDKNWDLDSSIAIGYQWDKLYGHKLRMSLEYHNGYSFEGQFSKKKTDYAAFKILYGY